MISPMSKYIQKHAAIMTSRDATGVPMSSQELLDKYHDASTRLPVDVAKWSAIGAVAGGLGKVLLDMYNDGVIDLSDIEKIKKRALAGAAIGSIAGGLTGYADNRIERALVRRFLKGRKIDADNTPPLLSGSGVRLDSIGKLASGMTYDYMKRRKEISMPKPEPIKLDNPLQKLNRKRIKGLKQPRFISKRITSAGVKGKPISLGGNPRARLGLKKNMS